MTKQARVAQWLRPEILKLQAYHVPDARGLIKLDAMENPYSLPGELVDDWLACLRHIDLNRYPDPEASQLKAGLRANFKIPPDMDLLLGNGSDELIQLIMMAVGGPGRKVLAPEPTFSMFRMITTFVGLGYVGVPLRADFSLDLAAMRAAIAQHQPAVIFLAYPNNPTGNLFAAEDITAIIEAAPGLVVVDEAYSAFCAASFMDSLGQYDNLLVLRTLSKLGLAGLRLGYLAGPAAWLREFDKIRLPYNVNVLTQASAEFAMRNFRALQAQTQRIQADRAGLLQQLQAISGVTPFPSHANFILFRVPQGRSEQIFQQLKAHKVLIKNMHPASPALHDCLRVTVGTPEENQAFISALQAVL